MLVFARLDWRRPRPGDQPYGIYRSTLERATLVHAVQVPRLRPFAEEVGVSDRFHPLDDTHVGLLIDHPGGLWLRRLVVPREPG